MLKYVHCLDVISDLHLTSLGRMFFKFFNTRETSSLEDNMTLRCLVDGFPSLIVLKLLLIGKSLNILSEVLSPLGLSSQEG